MPKHDQNLIQHRVARVIREQRLIDSGDLIIIALSGGPDSVCLFDILNNLKEKYAFSLKACHYNHRLRGEESDRDQRFVQNLCSHRGVELLLGSRGEVEIVKNEDDARKLRYAFFEKIFAEQGRGAVKIALAHNLNDLAETLLLRLIRGSGLRGLSSIIPQRDFFIRPLLSVLRQDIMAYLKNTDLEYVIDSSNKNNKYQRNKIRNELIPQLEIYNPRLIESLARTAVSVSEDFSLLNEIVNGEYKRIIQEKNAAITIPAREYRLLKPSLRKNILRVAFNKLFINNDISFEQYNKIDQIIMSGVGKKLLPLPHSLRFEVKDGIIYTYRQSNIEENDGKP